MASFFIEPLEARQLLSTVAVNLGTTAQTIRAMGGNIAKNARNAGAPVSDSNTKYDLANIHVSQLRVAIPLNGWEPTPDNNDPNVINWKGFKDTGSQHQEFLQLQDFQKRGISLMASVFDGPNWMVIDPQDRQHRVVDPKKYGMLAESIGAWLLRLRDTYKVTIDRISFNESNAGYNLRMSQKYFVPFLKIAGPMFKKMGIGNVKWVLGDDGFVGTGTFVAPMLAETSVSQYIADIGWHTWNLDNFSDSAFTSLVNIAKKYHKEIWATETGYDPLINDQHPQDIPSWNNAMQYALIYSRSLAVVHVTVMDYWEMANDFPLVSAANKPYPIFYIIKAFNDNLPPGTQVVQAKSDDSKVLSLAAKDQKHNHFFGQAINTSSASKTVTFTGLPNVALTLTRSSAKENGKVIGTYTPKNGKLTLTLPASSVSNLTGKLTAGKTAVAISRSFSATPLLRQTA